MKKVIKLVLFNLIFLFIIFSILELFLHIYKPNHLKHDEILGWKLKDNLNFTRTEKDLYGNLYKVNFKTDSNGIINFGSENGDEIIVIGDSFSTDPYVSVDKMWYSVLANNLMNKRKIDIKIKALGAGGYGSLQQFLLLKRLKNNLNPKIVILQFCSNDYENNLLDLEILRGSINQYARRPYLDSNEKIIYSQNLIDKILRNKYIGQSRIINKIYFVLFKKNNKTIPNELRIKSRNNTIAILKDMKKVFPNKNYFIFNCEENKKFWKIMAKNLGYIPIEEVDYNLDLAKKNKRKIFYKDGGHLNEAGHKIIGDSISENLILLNSF